MPSFEKYQRTQAAVQRLIERDRDERSSSPASGVAAQEEARSSINSDRYASLQTKGKSREDEIYDALTAGITKKEPEAKSTPERDKLVNDLQALRNSKGFVVDDLSRANYEQTEQKILADLAAWDAKLGNGPQDYGDKEAERANNSRVANTWGASVSSSAAGLSNAAATLLDAENARRSRDHVLKNAIEGSDFASQVGDAGVEKFLASAPQGDEAYGIARQETIKNLQGFADVAQKDSDRMLASAKDGLGAAGRTAVDVGKGLFDVAGDVALNTVAPGLGMARMGTSAFGSAAQEARQSGADINRQVLAGVKSAGIEMLTEKIGGPFEKAYGKTLLGKATREAVEKFGKSSAFKRFMLKSGANFLAEGGEEMLSNILNTATDRVIERVDAGYYAKLLEVDRLIFQIEQAREAGLPTADLEQQLQHAEAERQALAAGLEDKLSKYDLGDMLYEGFVGGLTGLVGGSAESIGKTRASVAEYRAAEQKANKQATGQDALLEEIGIEEPYAEQQAAQPQPNGQDALLEAAGFAQQTQAAESPVSAQEAAGDIPAPPNGSEGDVGAPGVLNSTIKASEKQENKKQEKVTVGERYAEDIKYLRELFEDSPVEAAKFARGQGRYGEYSAFDRAGILNEIEGSDRYYVSGGEVARDRTPTSKRVDSPDTKTLPSNFRAPKKSAANKPSNVPPPTPASRQIDSPNDIVAGMGVVHKSGKTGEVVLIDGDKVYVQLSGEKEAIAYSKSKFGDFFRVRESKPGGANSAQQDADAGDDSGLPLRLDRDTVGKNSNGGTASGQEGRRQNFDARLQASADAGGDQGSTQRNGRKDLGGSLRQSDAGVEIDSYPGGNQSAGVGSGIAAVTQQSRYQAASKIKDQNIRNSCEGALRSYRKGFIAEAELRRVLNSELSRCSSDDFENVILASGGAVVDRSDMSSDMRSAVEKQKKRDRDVPVVVVDSDLNYLEGVAGAILRDNGPFIVVNMRRLNRLLANGNTTIEKIIDHEYGHVLLKRYHVDGAMIEGWFSSIYSKHSPEYKALIDSLLAHRNNWHKSATVDELWKEVACDLYAGEFRAFGNTAETTAKELADVVRGRLRSRGAASKVDSAVFGNKSFDSDVEQSLNKRDREADDLERRDRQREEDRYQELRYSDKRGFDNAKGWDAERKASAEEPVAKYDPVKDLGEELYGKVAKSAAKLRKASKKADGDSDGFKKVSGAIDALDSFINGESSFSDFVDAYTEDEDSPFYEKTVADAMKRAKKAIGSGELSPEARDFVERSIRLFEHRVQYAEKVGNVERERLVSEIRNDKKARIGIPKAISDIAGHYKAMQLRPDVMFKQLGNFKKGSQMYRLADEHLQAIKNKQNFKQEALDYFTEATKMKGYEDFARGKTKIRNPIPGFADSEISLNTALGLLKVLETDGAIEHIVKNGAEFAVNERELYRGVNNNGFSDTAKYGQHLSLVSEQTMDRHKKALDAAKKAHDSKAFAHADSILAAEIARLRDSLKAEILANPVSKAAYYASIRSVKHISKPMNDASQVMWGEDVATEGDNYYPLEIAGEGRNRELLNDRMSGLKNKGIIQERTGPTGALRIRPFTDTMSRYIDEATDWAAFSVLSDRLELMSRNGWGDTLAGAVGNEYGKYYADWLDNYAKDLNGTREGDVRFAQLRGNLASAALTLNAGVALKQTPSYFDAAGEIDMDILLSHAPGLLMSGKYRESNPLVQEVEQRTRMLASRREGGNVMGEATESARSLGGRVNRLLPSWATNWITQMDVRTTSNLMLACADQVSRDNPDIKQGSEEYYRAVADKFEDVILKTQPVYTKQARADYMRAPNDVIRTLAMFRTQQTQNFNQLVLAIGEYQNATASEKASAKRHLDQVLAGQSAASIMFGVLSAVARASLHKFDDFEDEEGNLNKEQIAKRIGLNSLGAMAGTVWFGGDVLNNAIDITSGLAAFAHNKKYEKEIAAGEVKKRKGTSESNDFGDSVLSMVNDLLSYSRKFAGSPTVKNFASVMFGVSQMLGIPLKNAYNLTNSATLFAFDVDRKLSGGGIMNDGSYDDLLKMWNDYKGLTSKKRAEKTLDAAIRARTAGNEQKFDALMSTLDYEDADVAKAISNAAKLRYGLGEISEEEYADILKKYGGKSAEEAEKKVEEQKSKNELDAMMQDSKVAELDKKISDAKDRADEYDSSRDYAAANLIIGALLSDADTDKLINAKTSKTYRETYGAIRKTGQSPKEAHETYKAVDNDSNGSLKQAEIYAYYKDNPGMEYIMQQIWASRGWKTSWSDYKAKQK